MHRYTNIDINRNIRDIGIHTNLESREKIAIDTCIDNCLQKGYTAYIEIGVLFGGNIGRILDKYKKHSDNLRVIGIDLFEDFVISDENTHSGHVTEYKLLYEQLKNLGYNNFELYKGDSSVVVNTQLDIIENGVCFIDGNHSYEGTSKDFKAVYSKLKHGYILFHDISWGGVEQFISELIDYKDIIEVSLEGNIGIFQKI